MRYLLGEMIHVLSETFTCPWGCGVSFDNLTSLGVHIFTCAFKKGQR